MPQFNWSILGPIVLAPAALLAGVLFLAARGPSHAATAAHAIAVRTAVAVAPAGAVATATPSPSGVHLAGRVIGTPHLRAEPGSNAMVLQDLQRGERVDVTACSPSCGWYRVTPEGQPVSGWAPAAFILLQGDEQRLTVTR